MRHVDLYGVLLILGMVTLSAGVENLQAHIPRSTDNEPETGFIVSFTNSNGQSRFNGYNAVLRCPVEACPMAPELGIFLDCSGCNVHAFEPYANVKVVSVHNPFDQTGRTQYIEVDVCAEQPIVQAYYVVVHCYQYAHTVRCENYNQSRCLYMRASLIGDIKCAASDRSAGSGHRQADSSNTLPMGAVQPGDSPVHVGGEHYMLESAKVSLFRFILSLLLLILSGYAGCRWYARSSRMRNTRRSNRLWSDAFTRTFGGGGANSSGGVRGAQGSSRSSMLFATNHSRNRSTAALASRLSSPTRILVVNSTHSSYLPSSAGTSNRLTSYVCEQRQESNVEEEEDDCLDACMRVLIRSDPNFAVQFAKYYRNSTNPLTTSSNITTSGGASLQPHSVVLPSYQEAISSCAAAAVAPSCCCSDASLVPPPPYSAREPDAVTDSTSPPADSSPVPMGDGDSEQSNTTRTAAEIE